MHLGRNTTHECLLSQLINVLSSFKCSPMMVCLKKMFNGEVICHLKRRLKRLCYYKWKAWYTLLPSSGLKEDWAHFYHPPVISFFEWGTSKYCHWAPSFCSNKVTNWKILFPWRKINRHVLKTAKAHFSYLISLIKWLMYQESQQTRHTKKLFTRISDSFSPYHYYLHVNLWFL